MIKNFYHNQPQNPSCNTSTKEKKKGAQVDRISITIGPKLWSQCNDKKKRKQKVDNSIEFGSPLVENLDHNATTNKEQKKKKGE